MPLLPGSPPIPSYDEAIATPSPHSPSASPLPWHSGGGRSPAPAEAETLLTTRGAPRRYPGGYRAPTVETDDEGDSKDGESDSDSDEDLVVEEGLVRREIEEMEMDDGRGAGAGAMARQWGKRIGMRIAGWKWTPRLRWPRLRIQLPQRDEGGDDDDDDGEPTARWSFLRFLKPGTAVLLVLARLVVLFIVMAFLYLLFSGGLLNTIAAEMGGIQPAPETLRRYIVDSISTREMRLVVEHFTKYAHLAGTNGGKAMADDIETMFSRAGLQGITKDEYFVYLNWPKKDGRAVEILGEDGRAVWKAQLEEEEVNGEEIGRQTFAFNPLSKAGEVQGPLIYANYGSREDFQRLRDIGVDTRGAVALVRYHGTQANPGLKVKAAEEAGFVGCLLYSDATDEKYLQEEQVAGRPVFPDDGVHRETVALTSWVLGDVLTPGWESKKGMPREEVAQTKGLVGIPSVPLGWRDASEFLPRLRGIGEKVEENWKLAPTSGDWWTGNQSSPVVRIRNLQDEETQHKIWNVYGKLEGTEQGSKSVIIGNQRDALAFGATDPHSGTAVLIETAKLFGELYREGWRPLRTIEFMSWDGEAYNFLGSTEFVEHHVDALRKDAFAYINVNRAVSGDEFHASGSPVFATALDRVMRHVEDPRYNETLLQRWEKRKGRIDDLAFAGSWAAFQSIAGTAALDVSFAGVEYPRHSSYDDFDFVDQVADPFWVSHTLMAQVVGMLVIELSDRHVLPFDMVAYGERLVHWVEELQGWVGQRRAAAGKVDLARLRSAAGRVRDLSGGFVDWAIEWQRLMVSRGWFEQTYVQGERWRYNERMCDFETALLDLEFPGGLPNRTQFRHVVHGPRKWSLDGETFPGIRDAVEDGDWEGARALVEKTAGLVEGAAGLLVLDEL